MGLKTGDQLPLFEGIDENGKIVNNKSLAGKKVILTIYAQDDSPSCTKQVCSLKDDLKIFKDNGFEIYGISPNTAKKHLKFASKYGINFPLIADTEKSILLAFGLYGPKKFMGKDVIGVYRSAIVINEKGIITHFIDKINSGSHGQQLMEVLGLK